VASPLADIEDSIRFGGRLWCFIRITILLAVFPLIFVLDGQESEKRPGTAVPYPAGGITPPDFLTNFGFSETWTVYLLSTMSGHQTQQSLSLLATEERNNPQHHQPRT
jgi:hypothetical protein